MNTKVLIFSAPPSAGKDTATEFLTKSILERFIHKEFKTQLNELVKKIYQLTDEQWAELTHYPVKNDPSPLLNGLSSRQAQIKVSEEVIKPHFGQDYFGIAAVKSLVKGKINVFSDGGFKSEVDVLINELGADNVIIVRIHRDGCDYSKDSRSYLYDDRVKSFDLINNSTLIEFYKQIVELINIPGLLE